jgi:endonuclease III
MSKKAKKKTRSDLKKRAKRILDILEKAHPDARIYLDFDGPFQLLIATILAAQCTDEKVNQITPELFRRYPDAAALAAADPKDLEELIHATGFFRQKTKSLLACSRALVEEHGGGVPQDVEALTAIQGVGRKTAAVVIGNAFGGQAIAVDTHVRRVSTRLGLAKSSAPEKIERELCAIIPEERWTRATQLIGTHGRRVCTAKDPDHEGCPVNKLCDFYQDMGAG